MEKKILSNGEELSSKEIIAKLQETINNTSMNEESRKKGILGLDFIHSNLKEKIVEDFFLTTILPYYRRLKTEGPSFFLTISLTSDIATFIEKSLFNNRKKQEKSVNSEEFYNKKISELEGREKELKQSLIENKNESLEQQKLYIETKEKLDKIENELSSKKKELELKKSQDDAKNDWEKKIKETFKNLREYLEPIETEQKRLKRLFNTFAILGGIMLLLIIAGEITLIFKITSESKLPELNQYLMILLPIPIAGALLWGFIFQMNRAQRQLIAISNNIHSIKYIQGLLLSINDLSIDVNDGIQRINSALDKIISNHLNKRKVIDENDQVSEEDKDKIDIENALKIISAIKK